MRWGDFESPRVTSPFSWGEVKILRWFYIPGLDRTRVELRNMGTLESVKMEFFGSSYDWYCTVLYNCSRWSDFCNRSDTDRTFRSSFLFGGKDSCLRDKARAGDRTARSCACCAGSRLSELKKVSFGKLCGNLPIVLRLPLDTSFFFGVLWTKDSSRADEETNESSNAIFAKIWKHF